MKKLALLLAVPLLLLLWWVAADRDAPPAVRFTRVARQTIRSTIPTNGKVEPVNWAAAHSATSGLVASVSVERGQKVQAGQVLITLESGGARAALESAQAQVAAATAQLEVEHNGGRAADLAEIENSLSAAQVQRAFAERNLDSLKRLEGQNAATKLDVQTAQDTLTKAQIQVTQLEARKQTLVTVPDREMSEAKLRDAEAAVDLAQHHLSETVIHAPMSGTLYQFDLKPGAYVQPGDLVATIGKLDQARVRVYVDEPELGRVSLGVPVSIRWDAKPDKQWWGKVDKLPTQIVALGSRQVGEVLCLIENPGDELLPGVNVNPEIVSQVVTNAVSIPKQALHYESRGKGVYKLTGDHVAWQPVTLGATDVNNVQVLSGVALGDEVALPGDSEIKDGMRVKAIEQ
jgi:HlyD family secretion protein